ncbi:MAG: hypothetical protein M3335_11710 [Actinomycetota bacterium]|nr:hypothetical protein [Actinomycetota bacterium]
MPLRDRAIAARRFLDRHLFPDAPPPGGRIAGWEKAGLVAALIALAVVAQLARLGWTASLDSLWAEDGSIFVQDAFSQSFPQTLWAEYSGYLVLVPRLIGEAASALPLGEAPAVVSVLSALLVALSGLAIWHATASHLANPYLRATLVVLTVLTPVGGMETIDSAASVSWYMLVAVFWLLLWRPRTGLGAGLGAAFIALAALSNPGIWFFFPLAALRALAVRDGRDLAIVGAYFGAGLLQIFAMLRSDYEAVEPVWTGDIWTVLLQRVADGMVLGLRLGGEAWAALGWPFLIVLTAALVAGLAYGLLRSDWRGRSLAAVAVPIALAMFVVSVYQRAVGTPMLWPPDAWGSQAGRYAIVPVMLLLSVTFVLIDRPPRPRRQWARGDWLIAGVVALLLVSTAVSLPERNIPARGTPPWDASLDIAEAQCREIGGGEAAVAISPPGWGMQIPCGATDFDQVGRR